MEIRRSVNTSVQLVSTENNAAKLHILARSTGPVFVDGRKEYEDLSGGIYPESVALDLEHKGTDPIGRAFDFVVTENGLECDALIYPDLPCQDRPISNEVLAQLEKQIPIEASILFTIDDAADVETLTANQTASVNGLEVEGPCLIHRRWRLRSLTLCRVGADPHTVVKPRSIMEIDTMNEEEKTVAEEQPKAADLDALLAILAELQDKIAALEARVVALETVPAEEAPAPIEEQLKEEVTALRSQMLAVMRSNQATQPVGLPQAEEYHDILAGSIRYAMQGLKFND